VVEDLKMFIAIATWFSLFRALLRILESVNSSAIATTNYHHHHHHHHDHVHFSPSNCRGTTGPVSGLHARDPVLYSITMDCVPQSQPLAWLTLGEWRWNCLRGSKHRRYMDCETEGMMADGLLHDGF